MAYRCLNCGNRASKQFPQGGCPACSSFNVQSDSVLASEMRDRPTKTVRELILLGLLVVCLCYGLWDSYIR